ncbi:uncharacterized protein LOC108679536 [Hyalella azteca]|uniref:Uncharacterized protein LOC108679536 n=1 Tax=Hyalella azteca TaxID=294128 RepID=A0A8B7PCC4_HYAAZ|nr:uncharacterized protein LOC108679536 [Hyalella azteca]
MPPLSSKMSKSESPSGIFTYFQESCIAIAKNPSVDSIKVLHSKLVDFRELSKTLSKKQDEKVLTPLLDYIIFPLLMVLKRNCSWEVTEQGLLCMSTLLGQAECSSVKSFTTIFTSCIVIIADRDNPSNVSSCSEELKLAALQVLGLLVRSTPETVLLQVYTSTNNQTQLGHAIFLFLKIAQQETNRSLRISALETVCKFSLQDVWSNSKNLNQNLVMEATSQDPSMKPEVQTSILNIPNSCKNQDADALQSNTNENISMPSCSSETREKQLQKARAVLSNFLPGICTASARIAVADETKGHKLTVASLETLSVIILAVLEDSAVSHILNESPASSHLLSLQRQMNILPSEQPLKEEGAIECSGSGMTKSWLQSTSGKVVQLVEGVCRQLVSHSHVNVRCQLALMVVNLLQRCSRSLPGVIVPCVEALATLAADSSNSVSSFAQSALKNKISSIKPSHIYTLDPLHEEMPLHSPNGIDELCSSMSLSEHSSAPISSTTSASKITSSDEANSDVHPVRYNMKPSTINNMQHDPSSSGSSVEASSVCGTDSFSKLNQDGTTFEAVTSPEIRKVMQDRLCQSIKRLPTVARASDSCSIRVLVQQLRGYVTLLKGPELQELLQLPGQCCSLFLSLASCLSLDTRDRDILMLRPPTSDVWSIPALPCSLGTRRRFVRDDDVVRTCQVVATAVGGSLNPALLLQFWCDALRAARHLAPELLGLLPSLVSGCTSSVPMQPSVHEREIFVDTVLEFLLTEEALFSPTDLNAFKNVEKSLEVSSENVPNSSHVEDVDMFLDEPPSKKIGVENVLEKIYSPFGNSFNPYVSNAISSSLNPRQVDENSKGSLHECRRNVLVVSNSLLAVAACGRLMGPRFVMFFSRVMCPLLEMCGHANLLIAHSARSSLEELSSSCGYSGIVELVEAAVPHFWFPLSMQLRRPRLHPHAPQILQVALACGSVRSSARLTDFLQQLMYELLACLDSHESLHPQQLLAVLRLYMATKHKQMCLETTSSAIEQPTGHQPICVKQATCNETSVVNNESKAGINEVVNSSTSQESDVSCTDATLKNKKHKIISETGKNSHCTDQILPKKVKAGLQDTDKPVSSPNDDVSRNSGALALFLADYHEKQEISRKQFEKEQAAILEEVSTTLRKEEEKAKSAGKNGWETLTEDDLPNYENQSDSGLGRTEEDGVSDGGSKDEKPENDEVSATEQEIPSDVKLIVSILERCCYLLYTRDRETSLYLLDTIELGCEALKQFENSQLPVLHKVWKPLMLRIKDKDRPVSLRALSVCCIMVGNSGDFLRKRCIQELLPALAGFLTLQSSVSRCQSARTGYLMSAAYNTQLALLEKLYPALVDKLKLTGAEMVQAVNVYVQYIDPAQPLPLVKASLEALKASAITHPGTVWFALGCHLPPTTFSAPSPRHRTVKLNGGLAHHRNQLMAEVQLLYDQLSGNSS